MQSIDIFLETIDSTQLYAKANMQKWEKDKLVCIWADEQTAGRGQFRRKWISPKGKNIYVTFVFSLPLCQKDLTRLCQMTALSVASILIEKDLHPTIKWPNDIRLNQKKLSGILCETEFLPDRVVCFLGIGINVNMHEKMVQSIDQPATSLFIETHHEWDRNALIKQLQKAFIRDLLLFQKDGFVPFQDFFSQISSS